MSETGSTPTVAGPLGASSEGGSLQRGMAGDYDFEVGAVLHEAWQKTHGAKGTLVLAWVLYVLVAIGVGIALSLVGLGSSWADEEEFGVSFWLGQLIEVAALTPLVAGLWVIGIRRGCGAEIRATRVFDYYSKWFPIFVLTLIMYILIAVGLLMLVLPGIYLAIGYGLALPLLVDKSFEPWEALETSRKAVTRHWFRFFGFFIVLFVMNLATVFTLFIGLIWTLPMTQIAMGILYRRVFGVESATLDDAAATV